MNLIKTIALLTGIFCYVFIKAAIAGTSNSGTSNTQLIIEDIICEGNDSSNCDFITKKFYQKTGDVLEPNEVSDARLRLGTLRQFKDIDVRLEKGSARGRVIVVFEVIEANQIQQELGLSTSHSAATKLYNDCNSHQLTDCTSTSLSYSDQSISGGYINTDYNFLGKAKQLTWSIGLSGSSSDADIVVKNDNNEQLKLIENNSTSQSINFSLGYKDDHFFDSNDLFFSSYFTLGYAKSNGDVTHNNFLNDSIDASSTSYTSKSGNLSAGIGKRFGRYSFISYATGFSFYDGNSGVDIEYNGHGVVYGYDTQNDVIFPTQGERFSTSYSYGDTYESLRINYVKNFALSDSNVLSLSGYGGKHFQKNADDTSSYGAAINYRLNQGDDYLFSGWGVNLGKGRSNTNGYWQSSPTNIGVSYLHVTDGFTYRLSLGLEL